MKRNTAEDKDYCAGAYDIYSNTDGIATVAVAASTASDRLHNLQGQCVDSNYRGIVIKNGKKTYVK